MRFYHRKIRSLGDTCPDCNSSEDGSSDSDMETVDQASPAPPQFSSINETAVMTPKFSRLYGVLGWSPADTENGTATLPSPREVRDRVYFFLFEPESNKTLHWYDAKVKDKQKKDIDDEDDENCDRSFCRYEFDLAIFRTSKAGHKEAKEQFFRQNQLVAVTTQWAEFEEHCDLWGIPYVSNDERYSQNARDNSVLSMKIDMVFIPDDRSHLRELEVEGENVTLLMLASDLPSLARILQLAFLSHSIYTTSFLVDLANRLGPQQYLTQITHPGSIISFDFHRLPTASPATAKKELALLSPFSNCAGSSLRVQSTGFSVPASSALSPLYRMTPTRISLTAMAWSLLETTKAFATRHEFLFARGSSEDLIELIVAFRHHWEDRKIPNIPTNFLVPGTIEPLAKMYVILMDCQARSAIALFTWQNTRGMGVELRWSRRHLVTPFNQLPNVGSLNLLPFNAALGEFYHPMTQHLESITKFLDLPGSAHARSPTVAPRGVLDGIVQDVENLCTAHPDRQDFADDMEYMKTFQVTTEMKHPTLKLLCLRLTLPFRRQVPLKVTPLDRIANSPKWTVPWEEFSQGLSPDKLYSSETPRIQAAYDFEIPTNVKGWEIVDEEEVQ